MTSRIVVVGASLAGVRAAEGLRRHGFDGQIVIIGAEDRVPYDRPPLSKMALDGSVESDQDLIVATTLPVPSDLEATWRLGVTATALDIYRRQITLSDGEIQPFDSAVIATGAIPRVLPGFEGRPGVHVLRTLDDALALRRMLDASPKVLIIGAGFIGLEVASSCRARGLEVTVLEPQLEPLNHVVGPHIGHLIADMHRRAGVDLRLGVTVCGLNERDTVTGVTTDDGERVEADAVVMGVGVVPATDWLQGSGVDLDRGVVCDDRLRVLANGRPVSGLVAAGDVARWSVPRLQTTMRVEHWTNAMDQGSAAARVLIDPAHVEAYDPIPYVWSDQLGTKLQLFGLPRPSDEVQVFEGATDEDRWVAVFGRHGRVVAALGVSNPKEVMKFRRGIETGMSFPVAESAD